MRQLVPWIILAALSACAHDGVQTARLPRGAALNRVGAVDPGGPFCWAPDGRRVAYVHQGVWVRPVPRGPAQRIAPEAAAALAWSADGALIATAQHVPEGTTLRLRSPDGALRHEHLVRGHVTALFFSAPGELLAPAAQLKVFSFGGNYKQLLHRWRWPSSPAATTLWETTIRRRRRERGLIEAFHVALSPLGDELVYARFRDPPNASAHLMITVHNLGTGLQRSLLRVELTAGRVHYASDGERLLVGVGLGRRGRWIDAWSGRLLPAATPAGAPLALAPADDYVVAGKRLTRGGAAVGELPGLEAARFSPVGGALLFRAEKALYRVEGLVTAPLRAAAPRAANKLRTLRRWRSEGLISPTEYAGARKEISP